MNKRQKEGQEAFLHNEELTIKELKKTYKQALKDINDKLERLMARSDADMQHVIYQIEYQKALKKQIKGILDIMESEEFTTVSEYLEKCYEEGFLSTVYDLQGQGIPLCFPMDQEDIVRAVQLDSKISEGLYTRLGQDVDKLKKTISSEISRGISTGMAFKQIAKQLDDYANISYNNAIRIVRTEGHRIQNQGALDACFKAQERGADVVKQWDSTLDGRTRSSHRSVDGEIRKLNEKFSNGLMIPGDSSGKASEVINCRCTLLQRARWALEGAFTKRNNFTKELESFKSQDDYKEWKKSFWSDENVRYMKYVQTLEDRYETKDFRKILEKMTDREYKHYKKLLDETPIYKSK